MSEVKTESPVLSSKPDATPEAVKNDLSSLLMLSSLSSSILSQAPQPAVKKEPAPKDDISKESDTSSRSDIADDQKSSDDQNGDRRHSHYSGRHGNWTPEEDALLLKLVAKYDTARTKQWTYVAKMMGTGRIGKQCRDRYLNHIGPDVVKTPWTPEEDRIIILSQKLYGNSWTRIAQILGNGRPANGIKNRWNSCLRHRCLKAESEALESSFLNGASLCAPPSLMPLQKARKRPSDPGFVATDFPDDSGLDLPRKMRRDQPIQSSPELPTAMDLSNASISHSSSTPTSPKMPGSPVLNSISPSRTISPSQIPRSALSSPTYLPNNLIWQALYPAPTFPVTSLSSGVAPAFISIRPAANMVAPAMFSPTAPFIPALYQQQQAQPNLGLTSPVMPTVPAPIANSS